MNKRNNDLWNDEESKFDKNNLQILLNHITGKRKAKMLDIEALFSGEPINDDLDNDCEDDEYDYGCEEDNFENTYHIKYGYSVVKSDFINYNANNISPSISDDDTANCLCVWLKGKEFCVTSLTKTLPTTENPNGDIVVTLMLKEPEGTVQWNSHIDQDSMSLEPSNMYGTSNIRQALIGKGGWLESFVGESSNFEKNYIVQPKFIGYQLKQGIATQLKPSGNNFLNGALDDVVDANDYFNNGDISKREKYISWGNDYVWLPSILEIDENSDFSDTIWGMSKDHIGFIKMRRAWLRSGFRSVHKNVYAVTSSGDTNIQIVTNSCALRPAMHLNLSAIMKSI